MCADSVVSSITRYLVSLLRGSKSLASPGNFAQARPEAVCQWALAICIDSRKVSRHKCGNKAYVDETKEW